MKIPYGIPGDTLLVDGGWSPISLAIKRRTLSDWSHVARIVSPEWVESFILKYPDRRIYIKLPYGGWQGVPIVEALGGGVQIRDSAVYANCAWRVRTFEKPLGPIELATMHDYLAQQIGKPYDWRGVLLDFIFRTDANNKKGWFCSELQAATDKEIGRVVIADTDASLIPPHFYAITPALATTDWHIRKPQNWKETNPS